jgi:MoaA/NifB/PqqE/SkfB family radical SAM enzyme
MKPIALRSSPVVCNYYLTYRCNAKCGFCDIWEKPSPYATLENIAANLKDLKRLGVEVIDFTGGEPLLHRQLPEILSMAKALGFITTVTTNCLLYPKMAEALKGKIDMLHFSLDSPDEDEHNESRGVKVFEHFVKSLSIAKDLGEKPDVLFTVFPHNIDQIQRVYETFCLPNDLLLILNPVFEYNDVGSALSEADLEVLAAWGKRPLVYLNQAFIELRKRGGNKVNSPVCFAADTSVVIDPNNQLLLPCYHLGIEALPINGNLYDLWHSPEAKQAKALQGKHSACEGCTINCYMQTSFATHLNQYFFWALPSTLKYNVVKGTWKAYL